ncbi:RNA recognition motif [Carpediemonas membranifera]|uniref:RNA recognition motif n=1 Tax=Carpediemonas membranifera TaxID=201153 RepID=A0A8J6AUA1_9EUKA|nr:RNA recognition motif [Carpediemonas membranifera]|eukprot:KAG9391740.1 RNA recognition motif [Carpediemonas membranifera]
MKKFSASEGRTMEKDTTVFVSGHTWLTDDTISQLKQHFSQFGPLKEIRLKNEETEIAFASREDALKCLQEKRQTICPELENVLVTSTSTVSSTTVDTGDAAFDKLRPKLKSFARNVVDQLPDARDDRDRADRQIIYNTISTYKPCFTLDYVKNAAFPYCQGKGSRGPKDKYSYRRDAPYDTGRRDRDDRQFHRRDDDRSWRRDEGFRDRERDRDIRERDREFRRDDNDRRKEREARDKTRDYGGWRQRDTW